LNISGYVETAEAAKEVDVATGIAKLRDAERSRDKAKASMDGLLRQLGYES
jgi:hypothetical protein